MSPVLTMLKALPTSFPRVSGDEPTPQEEEEKACLFSPRERG